MPSSVRIHSRLIGTSLCSTRANSTSGRVICPVLAAELVPEQPDNARMIATASNPAPQIRIWLLDLRLIVSPRLVKNNHGRGRDVPAIASAQPFRQERDLSEKKGRTD